MQVSTDLLDDTVLLSIHPGEVLPSSALLTPWFCWMWWRRLRGCSTGIHLFFRLNNFLIMVARFYALITLEEGEDIEMKVLPCSRISVTFLLPCLVSVTICFSFPLSELGSANLSLGLRVEAWRQNCQALAFLILLQLACYRWENTFSTCWL